MIICYYKSNRYNYNSYYHDQRWDLGWWEIWDFTAEWSDEKLWKLTVLCHINLIVRQLNTIFDKYKNKLSLSQMYY